VTSYCRFLSLNLNIFILTWSTRWVMGNWVILLCTSILYLKAYGNQCYGSVGFWAPRIRTGIFFAGSGSWSFLLFWRKVKNYKLINASLSPKIVSKILLFTVRSNRINIVLHHMKATPFCQLTDKGRIRNFWELIRGSGSLPNLTEPEHCVCNQI
jgi:hypothetical protein